MKTEPLSFTVAGRRVYGELLLPENAKGPLPAAIISHGFGSDHERTEELIGRSLAMSGYAVYCFDFCGGGEASKSSGSMSDMSVLTEKEELLGVMDQLWQMNIVDRNRFYLIGASQGGLVSALSAEERPEMVKALVLYYPAFCIPADAHRRFHSLKDVPEKIETMGHKIGRKYYEDVWDMDVYAGMAGFNAPVLIVHGGEDEIVDVSYSEKAAKCYPNAHLEVLEGEGHGFYAEGKERAAAIVFDFLESCS